MLLLLPRDLSVHLLNDWLEGTSLLTLSALDVAFCNHAGRMYWLEMLTYARVQEDTTRKPFNKYLAWLKKRKVQLEGLLVDMKAVGPLTKANQHLVLPHVTKMTFLADSFRSKPIAFLSCFPSLTQLEFDQCDQLSDTMLLEVCAQPLLLKKLILSGCTQISPDVVARLAISLSATLEVFYCDVLDNAAVLQLAQHCPLLHDISWACDGDILSADTLAVLFSSKAALRYIHLYCNYYPDLSPVTNELVEQISMQCSKLMEVDLLDNDDLTVAALTPLISNCSNLCLVCLCQVQLELEWCDGQRKAELQVLDDIIDDLQLVLTSITGLVALASLASEKNKIISISAQGLQMLARHGRTLVNVELDFDKTVEQQDVQHFLEQCPHLTKLFLAAAAPTKPDQLSSEVITSLPRLCPQLSSLVVDCAMTDDVFAQALRGFPRNQMTNLGLYFCSQLTDAIFAEIATCCPNLTRLIVRLHKAAGVTSAGMLECICQLPSLVEVSTDSEDSNAWIEGELITRGLHRSTLKFC